MKAEVAKPLEGTDAEAAAEEPTAKACGVHRVYALHSLLQHTNKVDGRPCRPALQCGARAAVLPHMPLSGMQCLRPDVLAGRTQPDSLAVIRRRHCGISTGTVSLH